MTDQRILIVEDEALARRILHDMLIRAGYAVIAVGSGEEAIHELARQRFDVLLTDLRLRKVDGMQVIAMARHYDPDIETIVLTGYATLDSAVAAVRHGAYNYILKPGQPGEIESSVAAALLRGREKRERTENLRKMGESLLQLAGGRPVDNEVLLPPLNHIIHIGPLRLDQQRYSASLEGRGVNLSRGEFALLTYLAQRPQQVVSPQQLVQEVMGYHCDAHEARDLIKARIWALRRKLEQDPANPQMLISVRGVGYMLSLRQDAAQEQEPVIES